MSLYAESNESKLSHWIKTSSLYAANGHDIVRLLNIFPGWYNYLMDVVWMKLLNSEHIQN